MKKTFVIILIALRLTVYSQEIKTVLEINNYTKVTSYDELTAFINQLDSKSDLLKADIIGKSVEGRNIYALKFSSSEFGKDKDKIKVLFFAQQHGNEQSGKEGALLLARELLKPGNRYLFDKIDFALIPQMNPDGSEANKRRNGHDADLNRNHLILTEPETIALHNLFDRYLFEVNMDVHEYSPYGDDWEKYGYRKNADITVGTTTNINISKEIRDLSETGYLPFIENYLSARKFSFFEYSPGGPPEIEYIRHSTFDINDGRQSAGIQNTFSFIQEGMNGKDDLIDNIKHRAEGQMNGMRCMLEYVYQNKDEIKRLVNTERKKLISGSSNKDISIQMVHVRNGEKLKIPLLSYYSGTDSLVTVNDYRPVVKSLYDVEKPDGYLLPVKSKELIQWVERQNLYHLQYKFSGNDIIQQYYISTIDSIDFEGDIVVNPKVEIKEITAVNPGEEYIFIPCSQLKCNLIVTALEPKSMLGLATYKKFASLLKAGENFPVLRVIKKNN